ncbi:pyrimidine 5'-nucleotidase [Sphingomonas gilva]|uniref:Pyrimidine 5'-nucleotidase n=1 Tax=Sphingomonas gilva TaxID=2305907 RepID=A0A396RNP6_9SPHN|nr:pyrimidine 5'-nucleotidase [Sphingomonas gilva]RHW17999.1 pyrimidine 5'-nucleotidase [Sphingomonas gilva]
MLAQLPHVRNWIFDLDNTLYPAASGLFALIDERMGAFVQRLLGCDAEEAYRVQKALFVSHGTTLSGLMETHDVDPREFLEYVHDIALDALTGDPALADTIARLPGRKLIFTNGSDGHARRVLDRLGLGGCFEAVHDIQACAYVPKPDARAYRSLCDRFGIDPAESLFADDMPRNLAPAKAIGMTTLWIDNGSEDAGVGPCDSFIDHRTTDLGQWLNELMGEPA